MVSPKQQMQMRIPFTMGTLGNNQSLESKFKVTIIPIPYGKVRSGMG